MALSACVLATAAPAMARPEGVSGPGTFDAGYEPSISGDGRFVAFAGEFEIGFEAGLQIYVRDRRDRSTALVSEAAAGGGGDGRSDVPSISSDGRFVAFRSEATDLVPGDTNGRADIFVRDRTAGTTTRVSVSTAGAQADGASDFPSLSADGTVVAFVSRATNLAGATDTTTRTDVFVHDLVAGTTVRVSNGIGGAEANSESFPAAISGDGRTVVFASAASNLVDGDTNDAADVFAYDRATASIRRVDTTAAGGQADGTTQLGGGGPAVDAAGTLFAFSTNAPNLLGPPAGFDIVARDMVANTVERLSTGAELDNRYDEGGQAGPVMSGDGRRVVFAGAQRLPAYLGSSAQDVFVRDRRTGGLTRVSQLSQCVSADGISGAPSISANGRWIAFQSDSIPLLAPGRYAGGTPFMHVYVASAVPPRGTEVCGFRVRPRTIGAAGGRFIVVLSKHGSARIAIFRRVLGRRFGRTCREPTVRFPGRGRCTRLVRQGILRRSGLSAGANAIAFNGRIGRRSLAPGRYVAVAKGSAAASPSKRASFRIR
jgi:Tol biopolymer transport system component